jgi:hypothetical protein
MTATVYHLPRVDRRAWVPDDTPDSVSPPTGTELLAAHFYHIGFYCIDNFIFVCNGSAARAGAAYVAYELEREP